MQTRMLLPNKLFLNNRRIKQLGMRFIVIFRKP